MKFHVKYVSDIVIFGELCSDEIMVLLYEIVHDSSCLNIMQITLFLLNL